MSVYAFLNYDEFFSMNYDIERNLYNENPFPKSFLTNDLESGFKILSQRTIKELGTDESVIIPEYLIKKVRNISNLDLNVKNKEMVNLIIREQKDCQDYWNFDLGVKFMGFIDQNDPFFEIFREDMEKNEDEYHPYHTRDKIVPKRGFCVYNVWCRYVGCPLKVKC